MDRKIARAWFGQGPLSGHSGKHMLVLSVTGFDPNRPFATRWGEKNNAAQRPDSAAFW
jgi:hypothetical protein